MTEEDIDTWYESQKEKLSDWYNMLIQRGIPAEERSKLFDQEMRRLYKEYCRKHSDDRADTIKDVARQKTKDKILWLPRKIKNGFVWFKKFSKRTYQDSIGHEVEVAKKATEIVIIKEGYKFPDKIDGAARPMRKLVAKLFLPIFLFSYRIFKKVIAPIVRPFVLFWGLIVRVFSPGVIYIRDLIVKVYAPIKKWKEKNKEMEE